MLEIVCGWLERIWQTIDDYLTNKPNGTSGSFEIRLTIGNDITKVFFKNGYQDQNKTGSGTHPRTPVSYIRVRNIGTNYLYMATNMEQGDSGISTPVYPGTEWEIKLDKNCIWSLGLIATKKSGTAESYTDVVVDFLY